MLRVQIQRMLRPTARRFYLIVLTIGVVLFIIVNILITLNIHGQDPNSKILQRKSSEYVEKSDSCVRDCERTVTTRNTVFTTQQTNVAVTDNEMNEIISTEALDEDFSEQSTEDNVLPEECPRLRIQSKIRVGKFKGHRIACRPHRPSAEACKFAADLFKFDRSLLDCKDNKSWEFCKINAKAEVTCNFPKFCAIIQVDGVDPKTGSNATFGMFRTPEDAVVAIKNLVSNISQPSFQFLFLGCKFHNGSLHSKQLVFWMLPSNRGEPFERPGSTININIVLLDSLSRSHFYRSLPLLTDEFDRINLDSMSGGEVLDFTSFQSVHGHSAENAHALFTGKLFPNNITDQERERAYVGIGSLYARFKQAGYSTMYQDDLCWRSVWGLRMELGFPKSWKSFLEKIKAAHIDDIGKNLQLYVISAQGLSSQLD